MIRATRLACEAMALAALLTGGAASAAAMTAAQIVEKNASARGGVSDWEKIQTMAWVGHIETTKAPGRILPFLLEQKRPNSTRFEVAVENQKSIRAYDGSEGWKLRPTGTGKPQLEPYSADELNFARDAQAILGPLMDDVAQGGAVTLAGTEVLDGRRAYTLDVHLPAGAKHRIWVDADSFLEVKYEREFRNSLGQIATTAVYYRDYRSFEGLQMPVVIESASAPDNGAGKMVIERIAVNPPLDERAFAKPNVPRGHHNGVTIDTRVPAPGAGGVRAAPKP